MPKAATPKAPVPTISADDLVDVDGTENPFGGDDNWGDDYPEGDAQDRGDFGDVVPEDKPHGDVDEDEVEELDLPAEEGDEPEDDDGEAEEGDAEEDDGEAEEDDAEAEEDDDSEDEGDEPEEDEKPKGKDSNPMVPRTRLNTEIDKKVQALNRVAELEQQLRDAQGGKPAAPDESTAQGVEIDEAQFKEMSDAMVDGETGKAMGIFAELMKSTVNTAAAAARKEAATEIATDRINHELSTAAESVIESYPEFDNASDYSDADLQQEVIDLREVYIQRGVSPGAALKRAARLVAMDNGLEDRAAKADPTPVKKKAAPAKKKVDVKAKTERAAKSPRKLAGSGAPNKSAGAKTIDQLTDSEFEKLSEDRKAILRGDAL